MGYQSDYMGSFHVDPPLNKAETTWLRAYAVSDRGAYPDDPFGLAMNPRAEASAGWAGGGAPDRQSAPGVPRGQCDWEPCEDGCHLRWTHADRSHDARFWLPYLVDTFIGPGATAAASGNPDFAEFTFDHMVNGVVAVRSGANGRIYLLVFDDNHLHHVTVAPGAPMEWYERPYIDRPGDDDPAHLRRIQDLAAQHGYDDTAHYAMSVLGHRRVVDGARH